MFSFFKQVTQQSPRSNVPKEILDMIVSYLSLKNARNLALTCRMMKDFIDQLVVILDEQKMTFQQASQQLAPLMQIQRAIKNILYPKYYDEICDFEHKASNMLGAAVLLLGDYSCQLPYYLKGNEKIFRFIKGQWNHSHNDTINKVLSKYDPHGIGDANEYGKNEKLYQFLLDIQDALLAEKIPLNPKGELVKRIAYIQDKNNIYPINLVDLCLKLSEQNFSPKCEENTNIEFASQSYYRLTRSDLHHNYMTLFVKFLEGPTVTIEPHKDMSIADVKKLIQHKGGISSDIQRLIFCGRVLHDEKSLIEYEINKTSTLHLTLNRRGD